MSPRRRDVAGSPGAVRRVELLAAAARVFAERGYAATTVREVADAAGILGGSLYYHFDSKESMMEEILSAFLDDMWAAFERVLDAGLRARQTLEALIVESFRCIDEHGPAVVIYQKESRYLAASADRFRFLTDSWRRYEEMWLALLERGAAEGDFRSDLDQVLVYRFIRDTVWIAATWYQPDGLLPADDVAKQYLALILEGIQATTHPNNQGEP